MKYCLITFRSVTFAQRGEAVLKKEGISAVLGRTPAELAHRGCGYSLRLRLTDGPQAAFFLRQEEVPFEKVYAVNSSGRPEELQL